MAHFTDLPSGSTRASINLKGVRRTKAFRTKAEARKWATQEEAKILAGEAGGYPAYTVTEVLRRYELEVSRGKRGQDFEAKRLAAFLRDFPALASSIFHKVDLKDLQAWRDERLKTVTGATVLREVALLRAAWNHAATEWGYSAQPTPWSALKLPQDSPPRNRKYRWQEVRRILRRTGVNLKEAPETTLQEVGWCFLVALHTAMRAGEVRSLSVKTVNLNARTVQLERHKTDNKVGSRSVPLFSRAARRLAVLDAAARKAERNDYFTIGADMLDALFRKVRQEVMVEGVTFHDSRADALTRMARRTDVMTLSRISGHRNISLLTNTYYRESAEEIAARLA